jgi:ankyrin repeat protein
VFLNINWNNTKNVIDNIIQQNNENIQLYILKHYNKMKSLFEYRLKKLTEQNDTNKWEIRETKQILNNLKLSFSNLLPNSVHLFPNKTFIKFLINEMQVPINVKNQYNQNIFQIACISDQLEILKFLYYEEQRRKSIKENSQTETIYEELHHSKTKENWRPIHFAIWCKSYRVLEWMTKEMKKTFFNYKDECLLRFEFGVPRKMNSLSLCVYKKNHNLAEKILRKLHSETDITPYIVDYNLLHWSCCANDKEGFLKLCKLYKEFKGVDFLIERLKDVNVRFFSKRIIHTIAKDGDIDLMNTYLYYCKKYKIENEMIQLSDCNGNNAMHYACLFSRYEMVKLLNENNIDLYKKNNKYQTCLNLVRDKKIKEFIHKLFISKSEENEELKKTISKLKNEIKEIEELKKINSELKREIKELKRSRNDFSEDKKQNDFKLKLKIQKKDHISQ